jgi:hypothetical protein
MNDKPDKPVDLLISLDEAFEKYRYLKSVHKETLNQVTRHRAALKSAEETAAIAEGHASRQEALINKLLGR